VGAVEAGAYRKIRESMTSQQVARMMDLRGDYIIDQSQIELLDSDQRGEALYVLCTGCHGMAGRRESHHPGPSLVDIVDRPIASARGFEYPQALKNLAGGDATWTHDQLDAFLKAPKHMAPGTKMEFAGLLQADDRAALIGYLEKL
jgi:cytochrome c